MIYDDYGGQWYPGIDGPKFSRHCLTVEENAGKNLNLENWPDQGSNPGPLGKRQRCYPSTRVVVLNNIIDINYININKHKFWSFRYILYRLLICNIVCELGIYMNTSWRPVLRYGESVFTKENKALDFSFLLHYYANSGQLLILCIYGHLPATSSASNVCF